MRPWCPITILAYFPRKIHREQRERKRQTNPQGGSSDVKASMGQKVNREEGGISQGMQCQGDVRSLHY
jgi:hypothetical protein